MTSTPYLVSGTVKLANLDAASSAQITFTINSLSKTVTSNTSGQYVIDLADIGYTTGDEATYSVNDEFNNEYYIGTFIISGENKSLDVTLSARDKDTMVLPPFNRSINIFNPGGEVVSDDNPFAVKLVGHLNGHPEIGGNVSTTWTITRTDGQPDAETVTFPDGKSYQRNFTYNIEGFLTIRSRWIRV